MAMTDRIAVPAIPATHTTDEITRVYSKVTWRLVPFLFVCYVASYLDRINVGFAQLQMKSDLGFSDAVYGLGAGIFFVGYFLFEVPSNLLLEKFGARKRLLRIMLIWGAFSAGMMFVTTPMQFYIARFLLGVFEAGFFPGIVLYLTYWYPSGRRGNIIALFMSGIAIAGIIGGPLSGWIMNDLAGANGWKGWQWMFLLEGLPSIVLGLLVLVILDDHPDDAKWLTTREKEVLDHNLEADNHGRDVAHHHTFAQAFRDPKIYILSLAYFTFICGVYAISFWLPTIVKGFGVTDPLRIGLLTTIPYIAGAIGMVLISRHSDKTLERRWHTALSGFVGGAGLIAASMLNDNLPLALVALAVATIGILATMPLFWTMPTAYLSGTAAAGGIALINSLGLIGGFVSPFVIGWIKTSTGSLNYGLYFITALLVIGGIVLLMGVPAQMLHERHED
jgi:D-galactonate transporter